MRSDEISPGKLRRLSKRLEADRSYYNRILIWLRELRVEQTDPFYVATEAAYQSISALIVECATTEARRKQPPPEPYAKSLPQLMRQRREAGIETDFDRNYRSQF